MIFDNADGRVIPSSDYGGTKMRTKAKIISLFLLLSILLTACNGSLEQAAEALEIMAENVDQAAPGEAKTEASATDTVEPASETAAAEGTAESPVKEEDQEPVEEPVKLPSNDIYIIYTSDVHCGIDQGFGYAGVRQIRDTLDAKGYTTLLVDDGDFVQGEPIGTLSKGEAIIPIMNALKYDVVVPGNHEFDYGIDQFFKYVDLAEFPIISCNFNKEGKLVFDPYIIKEVAGLKIAFVGVITPRTMTSVSPKTFMDKNGNYIYGFMQGNGSELYKAVQDAVDDARKEGADYVYIMGHVGGDKTTAPYTYSDIIANTSGIDVFLDGHKHDTEQVVLKNKNGEEVTRTACGTKLNCVGYSHIKAEDGSIETGIWTWDNEESIPALLGIRNDISDLIDEKMKDLDKELEKVVARSDVELTVNDPEETDSKGLPVRKVRSAETNLGDLCADAARVRTGSDIGIVNGGGVRANIDKGDITYGEIIGVHPFGNKTVIIEVTGQQLADAIEWSCRKLPEENGGFFQVSGISYDVDVKIASPCTDDKEGLMTGISGDRRVSNIKAAGKPIDPDAKYTVSGNAYTLVNNGDGLTAFNGCEVIAEDAGLDNQLLIDYIVESLGGTIGKDYSDPRGQGRIVIND